MIKKIKTFIRFLLIFLATISLMSCQKLFNKTSFEPLSYGLNPLGNHKIVFEFRYIQGDEEDTLYLILNTVQEFPCCNYWIQNTTFSDEENIVVLIDGIYIPEYCLTAIGPASAWIKLYNAEPGRSYKLGFVNSGRADQYLIHVNSNMEVTINIVKSEFTFPKY